MTQLLEISVIRPSDPAWDSARQGWNLAVDQRPAVVAFPNDASDVRRLVTWASSSGLRVVTQGTGHGAATYGSLEDALLLRTTRMRGLDIVGTTCRVEAGAVWGEVARAAGELGLAGLAGSSTDVGVVGYTLGGGIGWLGRRYGLAANAVTAVELVTADGSLVRADHRREPELFWALRGGGGGVGVVTAVEFDLVALGSVHAGTLAWDVEHAPAVFDAWQRWTADLPESVTSIIRFLNLPPIPVVPEPFRGRRVVTLGAAVTDPDDRHHIDFMRSVATPFLDTFGTLPTAELGHLHGDPEGPTPGVAHHTLLKSLDADALSTFVDAGSVAPLISVEIRHLGGALARIPDRAGALSHIAAPFVLNAVGMPGSEEALTQVVEAMRPWSAGSYLNFAERPTDDAFDPIVGARLAAVKAAWDPEGRFLTRR